MIYRKNIYQWEQASRVLLGAALAIYGLWAMPGSLWGFGLAASGIGLALTGVFGYCPVCAMFGRKLPTGPK